MAGPSRSSDGWPLPAGITCKLGVFLTILLIDLYLFSPGSPLWDLTSYELNFYKITDYKQYTFNTSLPTVRDNCSIVDTGYGNMYKCDESIPSDAKRLKIAIVTYHSFKNASSKTKYEHMVQSNHLAYAILHHYTYLDITGNLYQDEPLFNYFETAMPGSSGRFKLQKPFAIHHALTHYDFDYVMWIDFDVIFFNCSTTIESIITQAAHTYLDEDSKDMHSMVFARERYSMMNAGVMLFRNNEWATHLVQSAIDLLTHAAHFQYATVYRNIRSFIDQNAFNALVLGFDVDNYITNATSDQAYDALASVLIQEQDIRRKESGDWYNFYNSLLNISHAKHIHDSYIPQEYQAHVAILPEFYINVMMSEWMDSAYRRYGKFPYDPLMLHFTGKDKSNLKSPLFRDLRCSVS